jgi:hypothetical protein
MPEKIKVFSPMAKDEDEYYTVEARLGELSAVMLHAGTDVFPEAELKKASVYITARRIYDQFYIFSRQYNRAMYLTLDEIKSELSTYTDLDDGIQYLLDKGLIKEEYREVQ